MWFDLDTVQLFWLSMLIALGAALLCTLIYARKYLKEVKNEQ